ncbi:hypothetical protein Cgig2_015568 [Carnegiea gigantea]|uniref:Uncharacterized protein n=1 Tax=Carnegiea gigantea TaxID=171969 RepID=A0A9Q1K261_9CARY|nr:hypothetical protein Cgig2_015568 [Carnegiea gigantea]
MDQIKEKDASAYHWLKDNEPLEHWARIKFDEALKSDDNTNNFVESFNNAIVKHRGKPVYNMLEEIRKIVGSRFDRRFQLAASWDGKVTPYVEKTLRMTEIEAANCGNDVAIRREEFDILEARCILRMNQKLEDYCAHWFLVEKYKKLYDGIIHPIPDSCMRGKTSLPSLDPPFELKKKGRLKKHKRRESIAIMQLQGKVRYGSGPKRCKNYKELGHNSLTCGKPRDANGNLIQKYKRKPKQKKGDQVGRPIKV